MRRLALSLLVVVAALAPMSCHPKAHERAVVAVSIFPVYDLVRRIAGPDADVVLVLPPGASPATWKLVPPPAAARARLFVSVGLGLDPWMDALADQAPPKARVLKLGDRVPTLTTDDGAIDPYVWMDPQRARLMSAAIADDLARSDSSHATAFRDRAGALDASLAALDREIEGRVADWPTHDVPGLPPSMAYFAERYGLHTTTAAARPGGADASPGASAAADALGVNVLGGEDAKLGTYEDLIRFDVAALQPAAR